MSEIDTLPFQEEEEYYDSCELIESAYNMLLSISELEDNLNPDKHTAKINKIRDNALTIMEYAGVDLLDWCKKHLKKK